MLCRKQETKRDANTVQKFGIIFSLNRIHYLPLKYWRFLIFRSLLLRKEFFLYLFAFSVTEQELPE